MDDLLTVVVRKAKGEDYPFIADSWRWSYRDINGLPTDCIDYHKFMTHRMALLWGRPTVKFFVAVAPEDLDLIMGWLCHEGPLLHYVYTKDLYRNQGVALQLVARAGLGSYSKIYCTHWTKEAKMISTKKPCFINSALF